MTKIYGGATNLIVWLGTETHNSCEAIEIIEGLAEACSECCNVLEVDDLIFQLTRGKHSIYTSSI
jgi:hypothetical protein